MGIWGLVSFSPHKCYNAAPTFFQFHVFFLYRRLSFSVLWNFRISHQEGDRKMINLILMNLCYSDCHHQPESSDSDSHWFTSPMIVTMVMIGKYAIVNDHSKKIWLSFINNRQPLRLNHGTPKFDTWSSCLPITLLWLFNVAKWNSSPLKPVAHPLSSSISMIFYGSWLPLPCY